MGTRPDVEQFVKNHLSMYVHKESVKKEIIAVVKNFPDLNPKRDNFYKPDGSCHDLVKLAGTIPVPYKGKNYNIPVAIWLQVNHPYNPPTVIVEPTASMVVKPGKHVDTNGIVYMPYLHDWRHPLSDVSTMVQVMITIFSEEPPVFARQANQPYNPAGYPRGPGPVQGQPPQANYPHNPGYPGGPGFSSMPTPSRPSHMPYPAGSGMPTSYGGAPGQPPYPGAGGQPPYPGAGTQPPYPGAGGRPPYGGSQPPYPGAAPSPYPASGPPPGAYPGGSLPPYPPNRPQQTPYPGTGPQPPYPGGSQAPYPGANGPYPGANGSQAPYPSSTGGYQPPTLPGPGPAVSSPTTSSSSVYKTYPDPQQRPSTDSPLSSSSIMATTGALTTGTGVVRELRQQSVEDEELKKWSMVSAVEDKVKTQLRSMFQQAEIDMTQLRQNQSDLRQGSDKIHHMMEQMQRLQREAEANIDILTKKGDELQKVLEKLEEESDVIDVNEAVITTAPLYKQMLDLVSEDNAIDDAVYYLGEALRKNVITLDIFLKHVRELSRRQYIVRALLMKAQETAHI